MKTCRKCGQEKALTEFPRRGNGTYSYCKECRNEYCKRYYQNNRDRLIANQLAYAQEHRDEIRVYRRRYFKERLERDLNFALSTKLRQRLGKAVEGDYKAGSAVEDLGCSIAELREYLESKFQPGMSWENWSRDGWHIDHIKPLASFDLTNREQLLQACHYTNLQPLWAEENLSKGSSER